MQYLNQYYFTCFYEVNSLVTYLVNLNVYDYIINYITYVIVNCYNESNPKLYDYNIQSMAHVAILIFKNYTKYHIANKCGRSRLEWLCRPLVGNHTCMNSVKEELHM